MDWAEIMRLIFAAITAGAVVAGVWIARKNLNAWRQQLAGSAEYETAKELRRAAYHLRNSIRGLRYRGYYAREFPSYNIPSELDRPALLRINEARRQPVSEALQDLRLRVTNAEVLWGDEATEAGRNLLELAAELLLKFDFFLVSINHPSRSAEDLARFRDEMLEQHSDEAKAGFSDKLAEAVEKLDMLTEPYVASGARNSKAAAGKSG